MNSINSGILKGLTLCSPADQGTRPTSSKVRQAVFNKLQFEFEAGSSGVDLFAGSGAMGLEMLSRGFGKVVLVENSSVALKALRKNLEAACARDPKLSASVAAESVQTFLKREHREPFDFIWADPPYVDGLKFLQESCAGVLEILAKRGIFAIECARRDLPEATKLLHDRFEHIDEKIYGDTGVLFAWRIKK